MSIIARIANGALRLVNGHIGTYPSCCCSECQCQSIDGLCHSVAYNDVGNISTGTTTSTRNDFFSNDALIYFVISCNTETGKIGLGATWFGFSTPECPTFLLFTKDIPCGSTPVGEHNLVLFDMCPEGCICGSITWTISKPPC